MYLSYDTSSWSPKGKGRSREALADLNPNAYLQSSSKSIPIPDDAPHSPHLTPSITSSSIVGLTSSPSLAIGPTPQPRINTLPTEILTTIFLLCLPTRSDIPTTAAAPLLLCHVCGYWRRLAMATPFLWLDLDLGEVRPGNVKRRVVVRDDDGEVVVTGYLLQVLESAFGSSGNGSMTTTNATSSLPGSPYPRFPTPQLKLHTLALPAITEHFASLSHPLPLRSLKIDVSRYRWDVKTDWERRTRSWVIERLSPPGNDGERRRVTVHRYRKGELVSLSPSSVRGEEEEAEEEVCYYELISARDVLESMLFAGGGFVAESVGRLEVAIDDLDDLPRVPVRGSIPLVSATPLYIPGTLIPTSPPTFLPPPLSPTVTPTYTFASLHTLTLTLSRLLLSEFDFTHPSQWDPLYQQLRAVVEGVRRKWGLAGDALDSDPDSEVEGTRWWELEGYALAFCHSSLVPNLRRVEVDVPWVALVPGMYTSRSSSAREIHHYDILPAISGILFADTGSRRGLGIDNIGMGFEALSILPYAQLTHLSIMEERPIPVWLLRALLVECTALKVGRMGVVKCTLPTVMPAGEGGWAIPLGGGVFANLGGVDRDEDLSMNAECYRAFNEDPVLRALSAQVSRQRPATLHQFPFPMVAADKMWSLPHLEELTLQFGCTPRKEDVAWVRQRREFERERWGPGGGPTALGSARILQHQISTRSAGNGVGDGGDKREDTTLTWRDAVVVEGGRVLERGEEGMVAFSLGGFGFGGESVVSIEFA